MPSSGHVVQSASVSNDILAGPPKSGSNDIDILTVPFSSSEYTGNARVFPVSGSHSSGCVPPIGRNRAYGVGRAHKMATQCINSWRLIQYRQFAKLIRYTKAENQEYEW